MLPSPCRLRSWLSVEPTGPSAWRARTRHAGADRVRRLTGHAGPPVAAPPPRTPEEQAAQEERWAERRQAYAKVRDKRIVELEHMSDPIARLLGAVCSFSEYRRRLSSTDAAILADAEVLSHLLPGIWARGERISLGRNPPWDTKAICDWFLEHVREQPPAMLRFERKRPWGYKEVRVKSRDVV